jgi:hypothetical protein
MIERAINGQSAGAGGPPLQNGEHRASAAASTPASTNDVDAILHPSNR